MALLLFAAAPLARAEVVHVAAGKSPTLQEAVDRAQPGDVILAHGGQHAGCRIEKPGQPDAWITLKAASGEVACVNAPGPKNRHGAVIEVESFAKDAYPAYWIIEGLRVSGAAKAGIDIRGADNRPIHDFILRRNLVERSGRTGIFLAFCNHAVIEGNFSRCNDEHGIYVSNSSDFPVVRGNLLQGNRGCGLHVNGDASMGGDGLVSFAVIEGNWIWANGDKGGAALNFDGLMDGVVRRNYIHGNKAGGITLFKGDAAQASSRNQIETNVIHMPENSRWAINVASVEADGNLLAGNIIFTESHRGSISLPNPPAKVFLSNGNELTGRFSLDGGETFIGWEAWRARGYDLDSAEQAAPPNFVIAAQNAGANDRAWVEHWHGELNATANGDMLPWSLWP
ncbi:right-handed parallel beta-helix repeat-containing protein [Desulfarculus baarsii]